MAETWIGTSGWHYGGWRKQFYPAGLVQRRELEYLSRRMNSVEINGTFYSLQRPTSFGRWYEETPPDFCFAVKGSRFITHLKRLRDVEGPPANFFASGLLRLDHKLGPILWQFPASVRFEPELFEAFLELLPKTTAQATILAARSDERMEGRRWVQSGEVRRLRYAFEMRHESFASPAFLELLRRYNAAMVVADMAGKWPQFVDVTADFLYLRLHGATRLYSSNYSDAELDAWASRIQEWRTAPPTAAPRDVYVYFDNDAQAYAPFNALALAQRMGTAREAAA
jgi:uncharacterized protein YecE (DUF72 family)